MMYLSICATLLTIIAAMHLLAKTNKETLGSLFKWVSYMVLTVATLLLVCQLVCAICKMCCHNSCKENSHCGMGMGGDHREIMIRKEMHRHGNDKCCKMEKMHGGMDKGECRGEAGMDNCEGKKECGHGHEEQEADSTGVHHMDK
ncbi:MAG: hypothetical protein WC150_14640 [Bacteroidia bacterium]